MRTSYSFSILRYIHDPITEEFVNIGVVVYSKEERYLSALCAPNYGRISRMFAKIDGERFRQLARYVQNSIQDMGNELSPALPYYTHSLETLLSRILPPDDSAFQFSKPGFGLSDNLDKALHDLFERFVQKYVSSAESLRRDDEDVWKVYREPLERRHVANKLIAKKIAVHDYEYEFRHSWKNRVWHVYEPISLDLLDAQSIADKANRWVGRATNLIESKEPWKIHVLLGEPKDSKMKPAFVKAQNILHKMPGEHEFVTENEAEAFAETVAREIHAHGV